MRRICLFAVLIAFALKAQTPSDHKSDDSAIKSLVERYMSARESQDAKGVESLFTADADQLVSTGEWRKGRDELVKGTLASTRNSNGKRTITLTSIRYITATTAIADGRYELASNSGGEPRKMWTSFVLMNESGSWKISAIRNMLPAK